MESVGLTIERILENFRIMKKGNCTIAGILLFGKFPENILPISVIKAVAFKGNDSSTTEYRDSRVIRGTLDKLFEGGMAFLTNNLYKLQKSNDFNYEGILEIPEEALEEALTNALIHRNYYIASQIRLFIFDNRVEIISPGSLPNTLTVEQIKVGIHIERNPVLASLIRDIEGIPYYGVGTGIKRIIDKCNKEQIKVDFEDQKDIMQFKVTFWRK